MEAGETTAPTLLTESELLKLMQHNEIGSHLLLTDRFAWLRLSEGTDATMAEHIKKIQERSYVAMTQERTFTPTNLGLGLVDGWHCGF